jgi:thiol-disulfide isomerase/thioredoxin
MGDEKIVPGTCFWQLTFEGKSSLRTWQLTMYLSPDQRFLTSDLFDVEVDPLEEERRKNDVLMSDLEQNKGASIGPANAPVAIVEFSDFQCPYCRRFAQMLEQIVAEQKSEVRVIFHHFPLASHSWARVAAEGAALHSAPEQLGFLGAFRAAFCRSGQDRRPKHKA